MIPKSFLCKFATLLFVLCCVVQTVPADGAPDDSSSNAPEEIPLQRLHQDPPLLAFDDGVGRLQIGFDKFKLGDEHYCLRTYNGTLPGPTILVERQHAGGERTMRVDLVNGLQRNCPGAVGGDGPNSLCACEEPDDPDVDTTCYDFNSTNLHTHGLHVRPDTSPDGKLLSDHVLMHLNWDGAMSMTGHGGAPIPDGACDSTRDGYACSYEFAIDEGSRYVPDRNQHEPGTFWYHAHVHGATAMQLANGMAGALIIKGPVDDIPAIRDAEEQIMVLQQIPFEDATPVSEDTVCDPENPEHYSVNTFDDVTNAERTLVNGRLEPIVTMEAGEVQRWRLIHAGISQEIMLALEGPLPADETCTGDSPRTAQRLKMHEIAVDGITLTRQRIKEQIRLDPGYRSDVMIRIPADAQTGTKYCVVDQEGQSLQDEDENEPRNVVAAILVDGRRDQEMDLPSDDELYGVAKTPLDCDETLDSQTRVAVFDDQGTNDDGDDCPNLNINCEIFPNVEFDLPLGATEEWQIRSDNNSHPYHIHVNPFTVCEENGEEVEPYWRDTLLLEDGGDGNEDVRTRIRSSYLGFTGAFVTHCHKLQHEDRGMMGLVEIYDEH